MTDPLDKATSRPPPTLGEGCLSRYDPQALDDSDGTEFPGAAELWQEIHPDADAEEALQPDAPSRPGAARPNAGASTSRSRQKP